MNKKFDSVGFQQKQRAKLADKLIKLSSSGIVSYFESKEMSNRSHSRRKRARAKA